MVSYKRALQVKYIYWLALAGATFFFPDEAAKFEWMDYPAGLSGGEASNFKALAVTLMVAAGAIYAAAAQCSESAQRKVLQYSMLQSVAELVCYGRAYGLVAPETKLQGGIAISVLDLLFTTLVCYAFNKKSSSGKGNPVSGRMKFCTRVVYCLYGLSSLVIFVPDMGLRACFTKDPSAALTWAFARISCVMVLVAAALIAAAQSDEDSTKKILQYSMTLPILKLFYVDPMLGAYTVAQPNGVYILWAIFHCAGLPMFFTLLACYPCSLRSWIIRDSYIFYAFAAVYHYMHPDTVGAVFGYSSFTPSTSYQVAFVLAFISLANMAAKRMDEGFTQLQHERYSIIIDILVPVVALVNGTDFGPTFICRSVLFACLKGYDLYCDEKGIDTVFDGNWFGQGSRMKSVSPKKSLGSPKSPSMKAMKSK